MQLVVKVAYGDKEETVVVRSDGTATGPPFQTVAWKYNEGWNISEYEMSVVTSEWVNCTEAQLGVPEAFRKAQEGSVCPP